MKNYRIIRFFIALLFVVLFTIITIVVLKTSASNHEQELQYFNEGKLIMYAGNDGNLTIRAQKDLNRDEKDKNGKYIRQERYAGLMQRSFYVGEQITQEDIKARFEDGVLKLTVPKKEPVKQIPEKKTIMIE